MSEPSQIHERHLRRLADMDARADVIAGGIEDRIAAAETAAEVRDLALAYQRITRGIRQIIALEAKLDSDQRLAARQARADAEDQAKAARDRRRTQLRQAMTRLIWDEADRKDDDAEAQTLFVDLENLLDPNVLPDDFTLTAIDAQIARLSEALGLPDPAAPVAAPASPVAAPPAEERVLEEALAGPCRPPGHDP